MSKTDGHDITQTSVSCICRSVVENGNCHSIRD